MISTFKKRILTSETYRILESEGSKKAGLHLWKLLINDWKTILFASTEGYFAEADLNHFQYSDRYRQNRQAKRIEFHILKKRETLPEFCYGITSQEIERRLAMSHCCYLLKCEDNIVCASWVGFGRISCSGKSVYLYSDHTTFTLRPDQAWLYDEVCIPFYRNKGLSTSLKNDLLLHLKNSGILLVSATVGVKNIANIKAMLRTGFCLKEKVNFSKFLFFKLRKRRILSKLDNEATKIRYHI